MSLHYQKNRKLNAFFLLNEWSLGADFYLFYTYIRREHDLFISIKSFRRGHYVAPSIGFLNVAEEAPQMNRQ